MNLLPGVDPKEPADEMTKMILVESNKRAGA